MFADLLIGQIASFKRQRNAVTALNRPPGPQSVESGRAFGLGLEGGRAGLFGDGLHFCAYPHLWAFGFKAKGHHRGRHTGDRATVIIAATDCVDPAITNH